MIWWCRYDNKRREEKHKCQYWYIFISPKDKLGANDTNNQITRTNSREYIEKAIIQHLTVQRCYLRVT